MSQHEGLNRRTFLRNAGMTAFAGAVGTGTSVGTVAASAALLPPDSKYDFDTPYNRVGTDSVKWDRQIRTFGKENIAVGMGIADMDFRAAPCITKALTERIQHENWGYLDMPRAFADGIINWNKRRYGTEINPDLLVVTTGVHAGLIAAMKTFSPPGSKVLLQTPDYSGFYGDIAFAGCKPEESPLKLVNGRYSMDFEDLERRISHDTNTLILCNPQNPTGNCWSREDLMTLGEICTRRRVVVLADEIHCDFVTKGNQYTPYASLANKDIVMNSITFKAASKSFSLAAMKCGWFFSDNADYIARVRANNRTDLNTLGMIASLAAYAEGEDWLDQVVAYIDGNHDFVESFVRANIPLVKVVKPQGTYLAWLDVSEVAEKIGASEMAAEARRNASDRRVTAETIIERYFVTNAKVHMNAGSSYGYGGAGRMRMNIATSRKTLEFALTNLASALKKV
jgi:cystathionine beta-lyase